MHRDKPKMRGAGLIVSNFTDQRDGYLALSTGQVDEDNAKVSIHPQGPSQSYSYTSQPDNLTIPVGDVLTKVDPRTIGHTVCTHSTHLYVPVS